ncbi:Lipid-A-disaccharide synthase [Rhynchospora pubera]|uniref:lipid-A-disaccharide synthase n=1 Tax=Rhynchospora pubera TaxID=906938 RepID=A0AAV8D5H7_9POAL|nr:Lipid-A-disaccharide synthase [Rhynchospora pubera]
MLSLLRAIVSHTPTRRAFTLAPLLGDAFATQLRPYSIWSKLVNGATREGELRVFLVAGEVSGDTIASRLMQGLQDLSPVPVKFAGVGGESMRKRGFESIFPMEELAVMGLWELLPHIVNIRRRINYTVEAAILFQPHVVVTVDSKGFSFRLLKLLRSRFVQSNYGPLHIHYVAPSFWAWKGGEERLKDLRHYIDHILCILPFEAQICNLNGLPATYVGHPLLDDASSINPLLTVHHLDPSVMVSESEKQEHQRKVEAFLKHNGLFPGSNIVTLLPGSRLQEVRRMLPIYAETMQLLKKSLPDLSCVIPIAPNRQVQSYIDKAAQSFPVSTVLIPGASLEAKYIAFNVSKAALCTSGSAVMELTLAGLPCVVSYRAHLITEWLIHFKKKINYISLPNILLNTKVIPEVLFGDCAPENLVKALREVLLDKKVQEMQIDSAKKIVRMLDRSMEQQKEHADLCHIRSPGYIAAWTILHAEKKLPLNKT